MSFGFLGPDLLEDQLASVLARLAVGDPPNQIETTQVDVKEDAGRRGPGGDPTTVRMFGGGLR